MDADVFFFRDPSPLVGDFVGSPEASVFITRHAYVAKYDRSATSGEFCVQFVGAKRTANDSVIEKWRDQCLEWCFDRIEEGRFGDQKYLDAWPADFGISVWVLEEQSAAQGPWNADAYSVDQAAFYHFHGLRMRRIGNRLLPILVGEYVIPGRHLEVFYRRYIEELRSIWNEVRTDHKVSPAISSISAREFLGWGDYLLQRFRSFFGLITSPGHLVRRGDRGVEVAKLEPGKDI